MSSFWHFHTMTRPSFSVRTTSQRGATSGCRRQIPSLLLCFVALFSLLPILTARTANTRKDSSATFIDPVASQHSFYRHPAFLRGGEVDGDATDPAVTPFSEDQYRTVQVQIVHRHGDRSPITPLINESYWASTLVPPELLEKISRGTKVLHHEGDEIGSSTSSSTKQHVAQGRGPFGKLTRMGLLQMVDVGTRLKEELEKNTAWSPLANFAAKNNGAERSSDIHTLQRQLTPNDMKVYSTDFARTIQSVQGVLVGFFPDGLDDESTWVDIDCRRTTSWMIPDPQPRRTHEQEALEIELATRPHILEREAEMRSLAVRCTKGLLPLLGDDAFAVSYGVGEEKNNDNESPTSSSSRTLSWAQLSEITKCLQVHNMLPDSISKDDQEATSAYCAWKWFESLRNPRLAYLSMHHFTHTIVHAMKNHNDEAPLIIFSCHDSSLIGLLCAFHLEQPSVWPEYGSVFKIELLEKITSGSKTMGSDGANLVVRFFLNGELLKSMWHGRVREEIPLNKLSHYVSTVGAVKAS